MPREKQIDVCSVCGEKKPLFDVKNKVCGSCAGKRGGGRPSALKQPDPASAPITPKKPVEKPTGTDSLTEKYLCDACGREVRYGQRKCACGAFVDWRGTAVEADPDLVICPECGAIAGHAGTVTVCPRCNYGA